jgi:hypothetical protein
LKRILKLKNKMINYNLPTNFFKSLHDFCISKGFSEEKFQDQVVKLGELVVVSTFARLMKQKPPVSKFNSEEEAAVYIEENFSKEDIDIVLEEEGRILIEGYFRSLGLK